MRQERTMNCMRIAFVGALSLAACHDRNGAQRQTQGAVGTAIQRVQNTVANAVDPRAPGVAERTQDSATLPAARVEGTRATVRDDAAHQNVNAARTTDGWALSWNDPEHTRAFVARLDAEGHAVGAPLTVRESRSEEEDVAGPAVASNGSELGVSWVDPANGAVRFKRLSHVGASLGRPTVVHDGLEMPQATRIAWNGNEYGIGVAMQSGVYFARVNRDGQRVGGGVMVAEDVAVGGIDSVTATNTGFQVAWHEAGESAGVRHETRVNRDGQVSEVNVRAGVRVASR